MKSETQRKYSVNGLFYVWNRYKFIDYLNQMTEDVEGVQKRIPQIRVFTQIADRLDLTPEAIKHWKNGDNSPVSIEYVKVCAEVLGVEFVDLLSPSISEEEKTLNRKEVALLEKVFGGCVNCYYTVAKRFDDYTRDQTQRREIDKLYEERVWNQIDELHAITDQNSLFVSEDIRYRVHRFLNDFKDRFGLYEMPQEWIDVQDEKTNRTESIIDVQMSYHLRFMKTHEDGVDLLGLFYIDEESDFASKLAYEYPEVPVYYYDNITLDGESKDENGKTRDLSMFRCSEFELTPVMLYKDYITRILKNAFFIEFPELKSASKE